MFDPTDPANLSPEQRLDELTALLALGVRRVLALRPPPLHESPQNPLDVLGETRPHGTCVVNTSRDTGRS